MVLSQEDFIDDRYSNPSFFYGVSFRGKPKLFQHGKRSVSYYLNAGYAYDNRYLLDANFRSDGVIRFRVIPATYHYLGHRVRLERA